ncbi:MAG: DUF481 domain-containing protein [Candidatus Aminicenantes bacterium]|nr:DUF481 domain-containing protein [Candidatus Aminicenantes bacterium]
MKIFNTILFLFLLSLGAGRGLNAQIVNIESDRLETEKLGWAGFIDFGLDFVKEERDIVSLQNMVHIQFTTEKNLYLFLNRIDLIKTDGESLQNSLLEHLRFNRDIGSIFRAEIFGQIQYNRIIRLKMRILSGAGLRILFLDKEWIKMNIGALYMFEHEEIVDGEINRFHRMSDYLSFSLKILSNLSLGSTAYYQPRLDNFKDWRISSESNLLFKISSKCSLNVQFNILHDSRPPAGVVKTIYSLKNGLRLEF